MGRPARNHGGTGGHGCLPLPGERPNYSHHVMKDKTLQTLVPHTNQKSGRTTKLEIVAHLPKSREKRVHSDRPYDSVSSIVPKRVNVDTQRNLVSKKKSNSDKESYSVSINDPRKVIGDRSYDPVCIKEPTKKCDKQDDAVSIKDPRSIQNARPSDSTSLLRPRRLQSDSPGDSISIKDHRRVQSDLPGDSVIIKEPTPTQSQSENQAPKIQDFSPVDKSKLPGSTRVPVSSVPMPLSSTVKASQSVQLKGTPETSVQALNNSIEMPGASLEPSNYPVEMAATTEQVNNYSKCLQLESYGFFSSPVRQ